MNNEILNQILIKKEITINDRIKFRTIFDVISALFTDENHVSSLKGNYMINNQQHVWFPNIIPEKQKEIETKKGYANYMSEDWNTIFQFTETKEIEKRQKRAEKYIENKIQFVTFAKINEQAKGIGYHFVGIFVFKEFTDKTLKTMVFKKISDNYKLNK